MARLLGFGFTLVMLLGGIVWLRPDPPLDAFQRAREALAAARQAEAGMYAPEALHRAEAAWDSALVAWQHENTRWFPTRDYERAAEKARGALRAAEWAATRGRAVRDSLEAVAVADLPAVQARLDRLKPYLDSLPFQPRIHSEYAEAATLVQRAQRSDDLRIVTSSTAEAGARLDSVNRRMGRLLQGYLAAVPSWQQWRDETIAWSARHRAPALVVDKMGRTCYLYVAGRLRATYPVELGPRWIGDKAHEGDLATPEGRYKVTRKLGRGKTIYHRALLINYPNDEDRRRFEAARRSGALPANARIGGLIELHGRGGRGADWTRGCIALTNPDMDALFAAVPVGTPVTIIGSLDASSAEAFAPDLP